MKSSLSHLPQPKQDQITHITEIIKEVANPEMVILFGSYAKGNYVEHQYVGRDGIRYEYVSDYDFLVVTKNNNIKEYELDDVITNRSRMYRTPVNLEIHEVDYINEGLEFGQYFFKDIIEQGITLFDKGTIRFAPPRELSLAEQAEISQRYFLKWMKRGKAFLKGVSVYLSENEFNETAFTLHQVTESFYYAVLLVFTGYKPKTHNLAKLRRQAKRLSEELFLVFPIEDDKNERQLFDLLRRGYVDARYKDDYKISETELILIIERVKKLEAVAERICEEKISSYS